MSSSKKKREEARRKRERRHQRQRSIPVDARLVDPDIHREIRYITQLAQAGDSRIVTLENLVLFSTRTRDAWLLDSEDNLALCLCREGEPQPFQIIDTPENFFIEWTANFRIEGEAFVVDEFSGRVLTIHGYPTVEISAACRG
jgi:hypothetical protein